MSDNASWWEALYEKLTGERHPKPAHRRELQPIPEWSSPFHGNLIESLSCPACEAESVVVREDSSEDPREAYCDACHVMLTVEVLETFGSARIVCEHSDCGLDGAVCGHPRTG